MSSDLVFILRNTSGGTLYVVDGDKNIELPPLSESVVIGNNLAVTTTLTDLSNAYYLTNNLAGNPFCLMGESQSYSCNSDGKVTSYSGYTDSNVDSIVPNLGCNPPYYHRFSPESSGIEDGDTCTFTILGSYNFDDTVSYQGFTPVGGSPDNSDNDDSGWNTLLVVGVIVAVVIIIVIAIAVIAYLVHRNSKAKDSPSEITPSSE